MAPGTYSDDGAQALCLLASLLACGKFDPDDFGRRLLDSVPFDEIPPIVERLLTHYLARRASPEEPFSSFARRHSIEELRAVVEREPAAV